jgi:hypothetical protein
MTKILRRAKRYRRPLRVSPASLGLTAVPA